MVYREATQHYTKAFDLLEGLIQETPQDSPRRQQLSDVYRELAWFLANAPDVQLRNPQLALELSQMALRQTPDSAACWQTLGVARYRRGQWRESLDALQTSPHTRPATDRLRTALYGHGPRATATNGRSPPVLR